MNIEHLRRALKLDWLNYYRQNREWIVRLSIWVNYQDQRRPSASFILGALSTLEPQLLQLLPLVVDLNSNPDRIILALGLNFNPEEELEALLEAEKNKVKLLPSELQPVNLPSLTAKFPEPEARPAQPPIQPQAQPNQSSLVASFEPSLSKPDASKPDLKSTQPGLSAAKPIAAPPPSRPPLDTAQLSPDEQPRARRRDRRPNR
jgi:hypothetical protein